MYTRRFLTGAALLGALTVGACTDLSVTNQNQPETERVLAAPGDVENLISSAYRNWWDASRTYDGMNLVLSVVAFQHSAMAANAGMEERGRIPRIAINNSPADAFAAFYEPPWFRNYAAISAVNQGLQRIDGGLVIGTPAQTTRAKAFGKFVQGIAHAHIALLFDRGVIYTEDIDVATTQLEMKPYGEVMNAALQMLTDAATIASSATFTVPGGWMTQEMSSQQFVRVINSYKARFRAEVARTPAERQAVNWNQVIADANAGITSTFNVINDGDIWVDEFNIYGNFPGAWSQLTYWVHGMADVSGGYQQWMQTPTSSKQPFLLQTPDLRFPQGSTATAQAASPGKYMMYEGARGHIRADRGTWRWSFYRDNRFDNYLFGGYVGPLPEITVAEMDLLRAEGFIRTNRAADAVPLINRSRVEVGGLPAVTAAGVPQAANCVPKLPNGQCGSLLEALKWEKRLETYHTRMGAWFFDSRGWGDLMQGTFLHLPVPAKELQTLQLPIYTTGGAAGDAAPVGTYGY
jgi:hypothetical protein